MKTGTRPQAPSLETVVPEDGESAAVSATSLLSERPSWRLWARRRLPRPLALLAMASLAAFAAPPASAQVLPDGYFPESIAAASDGTLYVGSVTEGSIVRIRPGADSAEPFVASGTNGLMSAEGLLVDDARKQLYVCTGDLGVAKTPKTTSALLAFDLTSGEALGRWPLPENGFCNDIARAPDGSLLVSDTAKPRILRFDPRSDRLTVWIEHPLLGGAAFNGNGIAVDRGAVYLSTFSDGRLLRVPVRADGAAGMPETIPLPRRLAGADALRVLSPGVLLVFENDISNGKGQVTKIDLRHDNVELGTIALGLREPTSGVVQGDRLIVLESQFRKLFGSEKGQSPAPFALRIVPLVPGAGAAVPGEILLPTGFRYPNGIARAGNGSLFVGSVSVGQIVRRDARGHWSVFFPGSAEIFSATSLRLDESRNLLWGTSPDVLPGRERRSSRVFALDVRTGAVRHLVALPDDGFGNDLALAGDGTVYVTDSRHGRVLRIRPGGSAFEILIEDSRLRSDAGIGIAGIALDGKDRAVVGNYGSGRLFVVDRIRSAAPHLRPLLLPRPLENPDGLAVATDGSVLVLEGAVGSGDGKLLRIPSPFVSGERSFALIQTGLPSPTNLTTAPDGHVYVTLSRIRHRFVAGQEQDVPPVFGVLPIAIAPAANP